jgi:type IV secretion system protein TrbL
MILTAILQQYAVATSGWFAVLFPIAHNLFLMLLTIELVWVGIRIALARRGGEDAMAHVLWFVFGGGIAYAFLLNAHLWVPAVINSFMLAGSTAAGGVPLDPSAVFDQGLSLSGSMIATLGYWGTFTSPVNTGVVIVAIIIVIVAFALIAGQLLITLVNSYVVIGGGVLLLGFGGSRWTRPVAARYLSYAIATGVQLFVLYLVIAVGSSMTQLWETGIAERSGEDMRVYAEILGGSLVYLFLVWRIPNMAYDMMHGAVTFTMHEGERMAVSGGAAGMVGGRWLGNGARVMANAAAGPLGALTSGVQTIGQRLLAGPAGGGGGSGGGPGGGSGTSSAAATILNQFRNAGQGSTGSTRTGSQGGAPPPAGGGTPPGGGTQPDLSFLKDDKLRERLQRFGGLGKE